MTHYLFKMLGGTVWWWTLTPGLQNHIHRISSSRICLGRLSGSLLLCPFAALMWSVTESRPRSTQNNTTQELKATKQNQEIKTFSRSSFGCFSFSLTNQKTKNQNRKCIALWVGWWKKKNILSGVQQKRSRNKKEVLAVQQLLSPSAV